MSVVTKIVPSNDLTEKITTQSIETQSIDRTIPSRIYWHEGMLLSQHLFQQNDLRNFQVLAKKLALISHYNWGVITINIDKNALSNSLFRLTEIEVVFQDGLYFQYISNVQQRVKPLELKLNETTDNEVTISIAITTLSSQISPLSGSNPRFYAIDGTPISDENLVGNEAVIPRLIPNAFLCLEIPEECIGFPIAKVSRSAESFYLLSFTPPCFYISKSSFIWNVCSELTAHLRDKINVLCGKASNSENVVSFDARLALVQLAEATASLETLLFNEDIKPYELFKELSKALGCVSAISISLPDISLAMLPYNHNDINSCILPIINLINKHVSTIDRGYTILSFNKRERFFYRYISQQNVDDAENKKFYIGIQSTSATNLSNISTWIKNAVIASDFALDNVRLKRIPGAIRRELSPESVTKIMPRANIVLFEIEIDPNYIKAEQNLHIFNPGGDVKFQPKGVFLYLPNLK